MRRECRDRFPRHRLQRKPLLSDPGMHHGTCVIHVGIAVTRWRGNVSGIAGACATRNFTYLARGPCIISSFSGVSNTNDQRDWCKRRNHRLWRLVSKANNECELFLHEWNCNYVANLIKLSNRHNGSTCSINVLSKEHFLHALQKFSNRRVSQ